MEQVVIKTKDLDKDYQIDGLSLSNQVDNIMGFYGIPMALKNVDKKFKTDVLRQVIEAAAPTVNVLVDGGNVQVLDPKSVFLEDDKFDELVGIAQEVSGTDAIVTTNGFQKQAKIVLPAIDTDLFVGDAFSRNWEITRRAEGGISFTTGIVRLACTNGMVVPEKQFSSFIRNAVADRVFILGFHDIASGFSVNEYLKNTFTHNGVEVPCSLADMYEMQDCLKSLTNDDLPEILFPTKEIEDFYSNQGIEVNSLSRRYLDKLPTGFTYYQALNILTHGAKSMVEPTIDNKIKVAKFCRPSKMKSLRDVDLHWEGTPQFSESRIRSSMGDLVLS